MNRKAILKLAAGFMVGATCLALAQEPAGPGQPGWSRNALDQMLGPIALYPDPLLAQILVAATQPSEIVVGARFVRAGVDLSVIDQQTWDTSVKGLVRYPDVLKWMDENIAWTTAVGEAFAVQQADVMEAIQRLRAKAKALGNLQTSPQEEVIADNGTVEILPASTNAIFVPDYEPSEVYYEPPTADRNWMLFGLGFPIGGWLAYDLDWRHHHVCVWPAGHSRPSGWWHRAQGGSARTDFGEHGALAWQSRARSEESRIWEGTRFGERPPREVPQMVGPRSVFGRATGSERHSETRLSDFSSGNHGSALQTGGERPGEVGGGSGFSHVAGGGSMHGGWSGGGWFGGGGHAGGGGGSGVASGHSGGGGGGGGGGGHSGGGGGGGGGGGHR